MRKPPDPQKAKARRVQDVRPSVSNTPCEEGLNSPNDSAAPDLIKPWRLTVQDMDRETQRLASRVSAMAGGIKAMLTQPDSSQTRLQMAALCDGIIDAAAWSEDIVNDSAARLGAHFENTEERAFQRAVFSSAEVH